MSKVSIITMCYGYAHYLTECMDSVQAQTFQDFEHIIVNPASPDNTSNVVRAYGLSHPVTLLDLGKDQGLCTSRNMGVRIAKGEYIVNLDADDTIHPRFLERLLTRVAPKTIVCPGLQEFGDRANKGWPGWGFTLNDFLQQNRIYCCSMFYKQDFLEVGGYDEHLNFLCCEDYCLWVAMIANGCRVEVVPEILFNYRIHHGSNTERKIDKDRESVDYIRAKYTPVLAKGVM